MTDLLTELRTLQNEINAEIASHMSAVTALVSELSDIATAGRVLLALNEKADATPPAGENLPLSPAPNTPETAHEAGGFDSRSLTEIAVKSQVQVLPGAGDDAKGGSAGMERSDGGESPAPIEPADQSGESEGEGRHGPQALPDKSEKSLRQRIADLHRDHPEYTRDEAQTALGCKEGSLSGYSAMLKIRWARADHGRPRKPVSAHSPAPAPTPAPVAERPPQSARPPIAAAPSGGSAVVTKPMQRAPKGTRFYLRDEAGLYLHNSCETMTDDRNWAWQGSAEHLLAVRRRFPLARDLSETPVPREAARAA